MSRRASASSAGMGSNHPAGAGSATSGANVSSKPGMVEDVYLDPHGNTVERLYGEPDGKGRAPISGYRVMLKDSGDVIELGAHQVRDAADPLAISEAGPSFVDFVHQRTAMERRDRDQAAAAGLERERRRQEIRRQRRES